MSFVAKVFLISAVFSEAVLARIGRTQILDFSFAGGVLGMVLIIRTPFFTFASSSNSCYENGRLSARKYIPKILGTNHLETYIMEFRFKGSVILRWKSQTYKVLCVHSPGGNVSLPMS
jgi:hypothetical protein